MKAEELKQGAKRTDVAFTSSSFLPDEPTYCFTEDELQQYADEVSRESKELLKRMVGLVGDFDSTLFDDNHAVVGWHLNGDHEPVMNFVNECDMEAFHESKIWLKEQEEQK